MQIYTNFESNSQPRFDAIDASTRCFRCKFTQILKAIHNHIWHMKMIILVVSDANLHKFWKQFTTVMSITLSVIVLFPMQIYTNFESNSQPANATYFIAQSCFRCKFTQILKAIHNWTNCLEWTLQLFPMQIYTNFESNSQPWQQKRFHKLSCFRCKFTQILKAIHNLNITNKNCD